MRDQAETLRMQMLKDKGELGRSIAVVSGKGGVGKSNFTINFSAMLAKEGKSVVVLDMDIGMGNIHILIGNTVPYNLKDYLQGDKTLQEVMYAGPNQLQYISGGSGLTSILEWSTEQFNRLLDAFDFFQKNFDYIIFDMGAGASSWSLNLLMSVDEIIVISTAEPTSITDAYSMMKYIYMKDTEKTFYILCNRAFSVEEGKDALERLKQVMLKFLDKEVVVLGSLPEDPVVRQAVKEQVPFCISYPNAIVTKTLHEITIRFMEYRIEEVHAVITSHNFLTKLKNLIMKGRD